MSEKKIYNIRMLTMILSEFLSGLSVKLLSFPKLLLLLATIACAACLNYTVENIKVNTDTAEMLSPTLPFQQHRKRFLEKFPQDNLAVLIVIDADTPEGATRTLNYLGNQLRREKTHIDSVYVPGGGDFFDRHGMLYLNPDELETLAANLTDAQPFIGRLYRDNSLKTFLSTIDLAITEQEHELPIDLGPLLNKVDTAIQATIDNTGYQLSWQQMMFEDESELLTTQRFILVKPKLDYAELLPAEQSLLAIRSITEQAKQIFPRSRIRITGEVALENDELKSVEESTAIASLVSLVLVCTALWIGLRSVTMMFATFYSLIMGLIFTAGFATYAVGHLNLISVAFSVLYIGLGVDYAIHLCLRYRELLQQQCPKYQALDLSIKSVGPSLALCAITTSVGFFAFVPTAYAGVSELGIIAGSSMFIALLISLTVLPATLKILPINIDQIQNHHAALPDRFYRFPETNNRSIRWTSIILCCIAVFFLTRVTFDFNPVNLRDPHSESVSTLKDLLKSKTASPFTLTVLADSKRSALAKSAKLAQLNSVDSAITVFDYIPEDQQQKLAIIEELALVLGISSETFPPLRHSLAEENMAALQSFLQAIDQGLTYKHNEPIDGQLQQLRTHTQTLLEHLQAADPEQREALLSRLQSSLLGFIPDTMNLLLKELTPDGVTLNSLPFDLKERWLSKDGVYRIMVFPKKDLNDIANLREFVDQIQSLEPTATDLPAIYLASGKEVVKAFQQALISALVAIVLVLLIVQRSLQATLLTLLPLLMAALLTAASTVIINSPFNFANVIAIPLIFGIGVDGGIHIMHRLQHKKSANELLLQTSTARAVFFSGLTTLFSFVSLAFTPHLGLASMGQLLAIGISFIVLCTLVVLPAFVALQSQFKTLH